MADTSITPNMNLVVPTVGEDPGPDWANNINADLAILDEHNHSSGQGVQINPNGLNINTDLPINGNNLTLVNTVRFNNLLASLAGTAPNLGVIYEAVNELYYNDGVGNVIQLTKAGSVNATTSGISSGTATASFVGGTLVVDANVNTPANVQGASFLFGNNVSGSNYLTLEPPNAMASNYTVTLPPINTTGNTVFLTYDTSNNIGLGPSSANPFVGTSNIQSQAITQALLAPRSYTNPAPAGGVAAAGIGSFSTSSTSQVTVPGSSITITTTGRPVMVFLSPQDNGSASYISVLNAMTFNTLGNVNFSNNTTGVEALQIMGIYGTAGQSNLAGTPASTFQWLDISVNGTAGTYTYVLGVGVPDANSTITVQNLLITAYEI